MKARERATWNCRYRLSKYRQDIEPYRGREAEFHKLFKPYEVREGEGNCLLDTGMDEMWDLITGVVSGNDHIYDNTYATIGVGDDATAADPAQTDLLGAANAGVHKLYKGMEGGFPTSTAQKATFKSSFGAAEANFAWNEWVVKQSTSGKCLNRKAESLGTKAAGTWTLEVAITLS